MAESKVLPPHSFFPSFVDRNNVLEFSWNFLGIYLRFSFFVFFPCIFCVMNFYYNEFHQDAELLQLREVCSSLEDQVRRERNLFISMC